MTAAVVDWLCGDYEVEPGHGANRSEYLYKHNVTTYLVKDNQPRMKVRSQGHTGTSRSSTLFCVTLII